MALWQTMSSRHWFNLQQERKNNGVEKSVSKQGVESFEAGDRLVPRAWVMHGGAQPPIKFNAQL